MEATAKTPVRITVSGILEDLHNGYTRTTSDKQYAGEGKSIEEKYNLSKTQVAQLFQHEKLRGRKTRVQEAPAFVLIDDTEEVLTPKEPSKDTKSIKVIDDSANNNELVEAPVADATPDWL